MDVMASGDKSWTCNNSSIVRWATALRYRYASQSEILMVYTKVYGFSSWELVELHKKQSYASYCQSIGLEICPMDGDQEDVALTKHSSGLFASTLTLDLGI